MMVMMLMMRGLGLLVSSCLLRGVQANYALGDPAPMCWMLNADNTPIGCPPGLEVDWVAGRQPPSMLSVGSSFPSRIRLKIGNDTLQALDAAGLLPQIPSSGSLKSMSSVQQWWQLCAKENQPCRPPFASGSTSPTAGDCCFWHINAHSCLNKPGSFCGPWLANDGVLATHTPTQTGAAGPTGEATFDFDIKLFWEGSYTVIGHFKFAGMQFAIGLQTQVAYSDSICPLPTVPARLGGCEPCPQGSQPLGAGIPLGATKLTDSEAVALKYNPLCIVCPAGFASPDGTLCRICPTGTISGANSSSCEPCPAGWHSYTEGGSKCQACTSGAYSMAGAAECESCPRGRYNPGGIESAASSGCNACPASYTTREMRSANATDCVCPAGSYERPGHGCIPCVSGVACPMGTTMPDKMAGFYVEVKDASSPDLLWVFRCHPAGNCPASADLQACKPGSSGRACMRCGGPELPEDGGFCGECAFERVALTVFGLLFALYMMYRLICNEVYGRISPTYMLLGHIGISTTFMQQLSVVLTFTMQIPEGLAWMWTMSEVFLLQFGTLMPSCNFGDGFNERVAYGMLPWFSVVLGYFTLYLMFRALSKVAGVAVSAAPRVQWLKKLQVKPLAGNSVWNCGGIVLQILFVVFCKEAVAFHVVMQHPKAPDTLAGYPDIIHYSPEHLNFLWFHVLQVSICIAGFYSYVLYVCVVAPSRMHVDAGFTKRNTFILGRWRPSWYGWGLVTLLRSLLITLVPIAIDTAAFRVSAMVTLLASIGLLQAWVQPWRTKSNNMVDVACSGLLLVMAVTSLVFAGRRENEELDKGEQQTAVALMSLCASIVYFLVFVAIAHAIFTRSPRQDKKRQAARCREIEALLTGSSSLRPLLKEEPEADERVDEPGMVDSQLLFFVKGLADNDAQTLSDALEILMDLQGVPQRRRSSKRRLPAVFMAQTAVVIDRVRRSSIRSIMGNMSHELGLELPRRPSKESNASLASGNSLASGGNTSPKSAGPESVPTSAKPKLLFSPRQTLPVDSSV
ncbi:unnamed protein product [Polarella glacialis]|uniref:Tyrosine-protein kinase ephrin type A/B receptor-like domain-containing protein n=1 Tax=Polarella glacialis TaxID=89957 RepID=A0A813FKS5_POLGL|nr:unnamed protein product [Polarella glacialis]